MSKHRILLVTAISVLPLISITACTRLSPVPATPSALPLETPSANTSESSPAAKVPRISTEELRQKMDSGADILLVDTRKVEEYAKDRIKGAISMPLDIIVSGEWMPPEGKEVILYCA